jgi:hypothetical protein
MTILILNHLVVGTYMVMQQPVLIDLLGLQNFAPAFGLFMMFNGLASLACQPFAGKRIVLTRGKSIKRFVQNAPYVNSRY